MCVFAFVCVCMCVSVCVCVCVCVCMCVYVSVFALNHIFRAHYLKVKRHGDYICDTHFDISQ